MSSPRHLLLILNAKAAGEADLRDAVEALRERGHRLDVRLTWEDGDAARHVREGLSAGVDTVVAGGGDGTLGAVAQALVTAGNEAAALPSLGIVPMGTANDFATAAGIATVPEQALELVLAQPARPVDMLRVRADGNERWALNMASGGFGTAVTTDTGEGLKKMLGGLAYVLTGLARLGRIEPLHARLSGPGFTHDGPFIALGIGNGSQAGGGQVLCPEACVVDGLLDLTVVPPLDGEVLATLGTLLNEGRAAALDQLALRTRLPWVEIAADTPLTLNLDGEPMQSGNLRIDCVPGRLRVHLPPDSPLLVAGAAQGVG